MTKSQAMDKQFVCDQPDCGRTFSLQQGLSRHLHETHGIGPATRPKRTAGAGSDHYMRRRELARTMDAPEGSLLAEVRSDLAALTAPLKEKLLLVDADIDTAALQLEGLRDARAQLITVLSKLDPTFEPPGQSKVKPRGAASEHEQQRRAQVKQEQHEALLAFMEAHQDELAEGFTATRLDELTRGVLKPPVGRERIAQLIEEMREQGIVRLDRVVRGGGHAYMLIGSANGTGGN